MKTTNLAELNSGELKHVILIDDDDSIRQALKAMLEFLDYQVHAYSSALDFLKTSFSIGPAVIITDMRMPDMSGVELQAELMKMGRVIPIIFISGESTVSQSIQAMKQGAIEFLIKPFEREQLLSAVIRGLAQDAAAMQHFVKMSQLEAGLNELTPRQREVFDLLAMGANNAQIQERLDISLSTAKQYKAEVMRKLNLNNLAELIALKNCAH